MTDVAAPTARLGPDALATLPPGVERPGYDRAALGVGMAHLGVGAFHRVHQAEYTDDMLARRFGRWGVVGINLRPPRLGQTLGRQDGLYTRLMRADDRVEARVIGSIVRVIDAQDDPAPALAALAAPEVGVVTLTVTENGYRHRPATGELDTDLPEVAHDLSAPERPKTVPGLLARALELRRATHGRPLTLVSCDNVPANGAVLAGVVRAMAERSGGGLARWIDANAAFPSTMVDRIAPATTDDDTAAAAALTGRADAAVAVCEPFRQWVIEDRFAGRTPEWDLAGAAFVADVAPHERLKMRVLNAAQSTLAYLGLFAGHAHTFEAVRDPLLLAFVRRMLARESLTALAPAPGVDTAGYVETSLGRLRNAAIRHRCQQIATDGSRKLPQRLVGPAADRLRRGEASPFLAAAVAGWMGWLVRASARFGRAWPADDPEAARVATIADRIGRDPPALVAAILAIESVFAPEVAAHEGFRADVAAALDGLLSDAPTAFLRRLVDSAPERTGEGKE